MFVFKAAVVGAGTMGGEIAQVIAAAGVRVVLKDVEQDFVDIGLAKAEQVTRLQADQLVAKGRLSAEEGESTIQQILDRIVGTTNYDEFADVDFVVEAVPERIELKHLVFAELDAVTPGHAILASNTSALSISEIALATTRPEKVVGFHFFYPASLMRLIEVISGEDTSAETLQGAVNFASQIRKSAVRCTEAPGFVVNRILNSSVGEVWRVQEEQGLSIAAIDQAVASSGVALAGPFFITDLLGLDTVAHVVEHLQEQYGDSFYVHRGMSELVAAGELGAKSGKGFYENGVARSEGREDFDEQELLQRFTCKLLREACLVLEDGVASARDIDFAMMAGAALNPPPFARADELGLDTALAQMQDAYERWGEHFEPPAILRRLVAQGRVGHKSGQGFFPYPQVDAGQEGPIKVETREGVAILWLDNPPANSLSPQTAAALQQAWESATADPATRVVIFASANTQLFCAGADIKAFAKMSGDEAAALSAQMHALLREFERSSVVTIAAVNALAVGGGCELAMAADVRLAAQSASFGQPEINLGIVPGFGGTQRLARLVGTNKALEMNLSGDPIDAQSAWEFGLINRVVPDHELLDEALLWARSLAKAAPLAVEEIKNVSGIGDLDAGLAAEQAAFARAFGSEDAHEGISAFLQKRAADFRGR